MAQYTNTAPGLRGINMKDGGTHWVEPGETVELTKADVVKAHADIKEGAAAAKDAKADEADSK